MWAQMGGHMDVALMEDVGPANKPRKENAHQQDFLLVFAVKSLRNPDLIYIWEEQVIGEEESHCWIQPWFEKPPPLV